ncbi:MAG TPA: prolyl-tRNA synthetase associated domain-containing protein [Methyloceanibacter sp.]|nr:prolyl-tRNA synthetase associated domain-containing protein [Methyloceanibacter sp.]
MIGRMSTSTLMAQDRNGKRADRAALFAKLEALGIATSTLEHEPMFTVEQSKTLRERLPGAHTKNLFLADKDGMLVLVVAKDDTKIDLKALAKTLGAGRFSFGKSELLEAVLGVPAGSVTPFALINASARDVVVVVDRALMDFAEVNCHPLQNTATTRLKTADLLRFIEACGHKPRIMELG